MPMAQFQFCFVMHVLDYIMGKLSRLFRLNNYLLDERAYSIMFHVAGLSFRDVSERYCVTMASRRVLGGVSISSQGYSL